MYCDYDIKEGVLKDKNLELSTKVINNRHQLVKGVFLF